MKIKRNYTIDVLRLIFAVEVVALHTNPFIEFDKYVSYVFSQVFSRLAVPFFSTVAGYFYFRSTGFIKHMASLKKYISIYMFWTTLMLTYDIVSWDEGAFSFCEYAIKTVFVYGWHHLWYLLGIVYMIIVLLISKLISDRAYEIIYRLSFALLALGVLTTNYGNAFFSLSFNEGIKGALKSELICRSCLIAPFFMLGYRLNKPIEEKTITNRFVFVIACCVGLLGEVILTTVFDLHRNVVLCLFTYPTILFLMIWALHKENYRQFVLAKYSAGMASMIYFGHFLIMMILVSRRLTETFVFFVCVSVMALIGAVITRIDNPVLNKLV